MAACQYDDPNIVQLSDFLNARAKLRHGALSHIITARILDIYPTTVELQRLVDNPKHMDKLSAQIAGEVLPGSMPTTSPVGMDSPGDGDEEVKTLPRSNSWSDLLQYQRA
jgi:hypothetical protein